MQFIRLTSDVDGSTHVFRHEGSPLSVGDKGQINGLAGRQGDARRRTARRGCRVASWIGHQPSRLLEFRCVMTIIPFSAIPARCELMVACFYTRLTCQEWRNRKRFAATTFVFGVY